MNIKKIITREWVTIIGIILWIAVIVAMVKYGASHLPSIASILFMFVFPAYLFVRFIFWLGQIVREKRQR